MRGREGSAETTADPHNVLDQTPATEQVRADHDPLRWLCTRRTITSELERFQTDWTVALILWKVFPLNRLRPADEEFHRRLGKRLSRDTSDRSHGDNEFWELLKILQDSFD